MRKPLNLALLLTFGFPLGAIVAAVGLTLVAATRGDPTLPDEYHWEGMQLDRDFADSQRAAALSVRARVRAEPQGTCRVTLELNGEAPAALKLNLVHGTRPDLDVHSVLQRAVPLGHGPEADSAVGASYAGACGRVPTGHWHLELTDAAGQWSIRQEVWGAVDDVSLRAGARGS